MNFGCFKQLLLLRVNKYVSALSRSCSSLLFLPGVWCLVGSSQRVQVLDWDRGTQHGACKRLERVFYADWVPAINEQLPPYPGGTSTERHFAPGSVLRRTREVLVSAMWWKQPREKIVTIPAPAGEWLAPLADCYFECASSQACIRVHVGSHSCPICFGFWYWCIRM